MDTFCNFNYLLKIKGCFVEHKNTSVTTSNQKSVPNNDWAVHAAILNVKLLKNLRRVRQIHINIILWIVDKYESFTCDTHMFNFRIYPMNVFWRFFWVMQLLKGPNIFQNALTNNVMCVISIPITLFCSKCWFPPITCSNLWQTLSWWEWCFGTMRLEISIFKFFILVTL